MGKPVSGSKPPQKPVRGKSAGPSFGTYMTIAIVVGAVAWMSLRPEVKKKKKVREQSPEDAKIEDRLNVVKEAFFEKDGKPMFESTRGSVKGGGSKFATTEFWEERYAKQTSEYDWYGTWNGASSIQVKPHVKDHLPGELDPGNKANPVLIIGCGSSRLAGELIEDGYTSISNVDISTVVIDQMAKKYVGKKEVDFQVMDITNLTFPESQFDVVFDKGTLDALYTGAAERVEVAVPQIYRVLRPGGILISMTFGSPKARKQLNITSREDPSAKPQWRSFTTLMVPKYDNPENPDSAASYFYIYIAKK